jgi:P27 family predicted phage terminase small subunit|tara:strand:- start:165 stop:641 length:477 start_codon:yes stop_codon:yes gene_type:complete
MARGRKKTPTVLKEMMGTARADRLVDNEMTADLVLQLPEAPEFLSEIGTKEWYKITSQLFNLKMLHEVDLSLILAYCNEMATYIECEMKLKEIGRVDTFKNTNGDIVRTQAKPYVKMKNDALNNALKLAANFGITPSARANISAPVTTNNTQINNYFE